MMKKYIYYHIYLTEDTANWAHLFLDQLFLIINTKLLNSIERMIITCIGSPTQINLFKKLCCNFTNLEINAYETKITDKELNLNYLSSNRVLDECITLKNLYEHAKKENAYFLYSHSKGITAINKLKEQQDCKTFINYYCWRKFMEWGSIEKWDKNIKLLDTYACVGTNFCNWPVPHYSGGFWWSKSEYLNTLPDVSEDDWWIKLIDNSDLKNWNSFRLKPEMWVGYNYNNNFFSYKEAPDMPPISNLSEIFYPRKNYDNS